MPAGQVAAADAWRMGSIRRDARARVQSWRSHRQASGSLLGHLPAVVVSYGAQIATCWLWNGKRQLYNPISFCWESYQSSVAP